MCFVPLLDPEFLDAASPSSSGAEGRYTSHALVLTGQGCLLATLWCKGKWEMHSLFMAPLRVSALELQ